MAKTKSLGNIYSKSNISISFNVNEHLSILAQRLPDAVTSALKVVADTALQETYNITPYDPTGRNSTQHLRDSAKVQVYQNGRLGGTCYIQWQATNPTNGYHYGIAQEAGGANGYTYQNYSTPGTGPGFMTQTWSIMQQIAPTYINEYTTNLIGEVSIK